MSWDDTLSINTDNTRACLGVVSAAVVSSVDIASAVSVLSLALSSPSSPWQTPGSPQK